MTQRELAERVGIDYTYVSKLESGMLPPPSEKVVYRLAEALNTDHDDLLKLAGRVAAESTQNLKDKELREFGPTLRELRKRAGLSLRELSGKTNINPSYISKIENSVKPPPSKKVIVRLAQVLKVDEKELLSLAGKLSKGINTSPYPFSRIIKKCIGNHVIGGEKMERTIGSFRHRVSKLRTSFAHLRSGLRNSSGSAGLFFKKHKELSRVAVSVGMVLAIVTMLLWSATPAKAVTLSLINLPTSMYRGTSYSFYAQVDINTNEAIPITKFRLDVSGPTPAWAEFNVNGSITDQSGHFTSITPVVLPFYGEGYRYGYGYGYDPSIGYGFITWGTYGYTDYGYGYGYGYSTGLSTQAKYLVTLNTSGMSTGSYQAQLACYVTPEPKRFLSIEYPFTIYPAPPVYVAPSVVVVSPGVYDVSQVVTTGGVFTQDVTLSSEDGKVKPVIAAGTKGLTADGEPISQISILPMTDPPAPPVEANIVGLAYDIGPDGATFEPPITVTFTYDPTAIPSGVNEEDLVLALYDEATGQWVTLSDIVVDPVAHTISGKTGHFTAFAIIATVEVPPPPPAPAAFTVSNLSVQPAEVQPGQTVTVAVLVANTGGESGSHTVVLKINEVKEAEKTVTIAAGASQTVSFSVTRQEAGTYTVTADGLSGSFAVVAPPPVKPIAWWVWVIVGLASAVAIGLLAYFFWWRRRII